MLQFTVCYSLQYTRVCSMLQYTVCYSLRYATVCSMLQFAVCYSLRYATVYGMPQFTVCYSLKYTTIVGSSFSFKYSQQELNCSNTKTSCLISIPFNYKLFVSRATVPVHCDKASEHANSSCRQSTSFRNLTTNGTRWTWGVGGCSCSGDPAGYVEEGSRYGHLSP